MGRLTIVLLVIALVGSNAWWAYRTLDASVTQSYIGASLDDNKQALTQTLALLPVAARAGVSRSEILAAARLPGSEDEPYEKDGFVWVGKIGLKFHEQGQLTEATRAWEPP